MILGLFGGKKRTLKNGKQELVEVSSDADDVKAPLWFSDCFRVSRSFSQGDRSAVLAAIKTAEKGEPAGLLTAEGSVTNELYTRMTMFGYLERAEVTLPANTAQWHIRKDHWRKFFGFIAASNVDTLTEANLVKVSKGLSRKRNEFEKFNTKLLEILRAGTLKSDRPFADGSIKSPAFDLMRKLDLIYSAESTWRANELGTMTLPYFFDLLLHEKRLWLEEQNA